MTISSKTEMMHEIVTRFGIVYVAENDRFRVAKSQFENEYMYLTDLAFLRYFGTIIRSLDIQEWLNFLDEKSRLVLTTEEAEAMK